MSAADHMADRHTAALARLTELGLALAERLHGQAMAAESAEEAVELANAFHRISRGVRQSIALEARLERERGKALRERSDEAIQQQAAYIERRKAQARHAIAREVWTEHEGPEAEDTLRVLDDLLAEDGLAGDFLERPIEALIARLRYDLALDVPPDVAEPPTDPGLGPRRGLYRPPRLSEGARRFDQMRRLLGNSS